MKSVRLGPALEGRLKRASRASNLPESEVIRQGVASRVDEILGVTVYDLISDLIVDGEGLTNSARFTDDQIAEELAADQARHRRVISNAPD